MEDYFDFGDDFDFFDLKDLDGRVENPLINFPVGPLPKPVVQMDFVEVFLKPAKSKDDQFKSGEFPTSMLCSPYKYHLKVRGQIPSKRLGLNIVFAENKTRPKCDKKPLAIDEILHVSSNEVVIKFALFICSFHFRRKEFVLEVSCDNRAIWTSTPFRTYARRRPKKPKPSPSPVEVEQRTVQQKNYLYQPHPQAYVQQQMLQFPAHNAPYFVVIFPNYNYNVDGSDPENSDGNNGNNELPQFPFPYPYPYYPTQKIVPKNTGNNNIGDNRNGGRNGSSNRGGGDDLIM